MIRVFALSAAALLAACSGETMSDDPELAAKEIEEKVIEDAKTLEQAADKALAIQKAEADEDYPAEDGGTSTVR